MHGSKISNPNILEINQYAFDISLYTTRGIYDRKTESCISKIYTTICGRLRACLLDLSIE
jgi:hypothetical protein